MEDHGLVLQDLGEGFEEQQFPGRAQCGQVQCRDIHTVPDVAGQWAVESRPVYPG